MENEKGDNGGAHHSDFASVPQEGTTDLVPKPSEDPRDPLNWSITKKYATFAIMCFAAFAGLSTATANGLALVAQAKTYSTTPTVVSYTVSAPIGGLIVGPLLLVPTVKIIGVTSCTFWSLIGVVATEIWAAESSGPNDYTSFAVARGVSGIFSATAQILTGGVIVDMFFLHERGRAFAIYATSYTVATVAGPTFSGFIVQHTQWPVAIWWTVGSNGLAALLVFLFVDDTAWDREKGTPVYPRPLKQSWIKNRIDTLLPGNKVVGRIDTGAIGRSIVAPFVIAISPVTILAGLYTLIDFSWFVMVNIELGVIMPEEYMFTPQRNAFFYFASWAGALLAVAYGTTLNDRIPMYFSHRSGAWHPEYRLYTAWIPGLFAAPIGCGLFGAAVYYHLHYMVLALGTFFIAFAGVASVPVLINYVVECFRHYPQEVGAVMNVYRLGFAISIPFFYPQWGQQVGFNWVYGMAAFFAVLVFGFLCILMWKGPLIREWNLWKDTPSGEEGAKVG